MAIARLELRRRDQQQRPSTSTSGSVPIVQIGGLRIQRCCFGNGSLGPWDLGVGTACEQQHSLRLRCRPDSTRLLKLPLLLLLLLLPLWLFSLPPQPIHDSMAAAQPCHSLPACRRRRIPAYAAAAESLDRFGLAPSSPRPRY